MFGHPDVGNDPERRRLTGGFLVGDADGQWVSFLLTPVDPGSGLDTASMCSTLELFG